MALQGCFSKCGCAFYASRKTGLCFVCELLNGLVQLDRLYTIVIQYQKGLGFYECKIQNRTNVLWHTIELMFYCTQSNVCSVVYNQTNVQLCTMEQTFYRIQWNKCSVVYNQTHVRLRTIEQMFCGIQSNVCSVTYNGTNVLLRTIERMFVLPKRAIVTQKLAMANFFWGS